MPHPVISDFHAIPWTWKVFPPEATGPGHSSSLKCSSTIFMLHIFLPYRLQILFRFQLASKTVPYYPCKSTLHFSFLLVLGLLCRRNCGCAVCFLSKPFKLSNMQLYNLFIVFFSYFPLIKSKPTVFSKHLPYSD